MVLATGHGLELDWWCFGILLLLALKTLNVIYLVVLHVLYDITQYIYIYIHIQYMIFCVHSERGMLTIAKPWAQTVLPTPRSQAEIKGHLAGLS